MSQTERIERWPSKRFHLDEVAIRLFSTRQFASWLLLIYWNQRIFFAQKSQLPAPRPFLTLLAAINVELQLLNLKQLLCADHGLTLANQSCLTESQAQFVSSSPVFFD